MFAGLYGPDMGVKLLEPACIRELAELPGTGPFGPPERPMGGYSSLPGDWPERQQLVNEWVGRAFEQVSVLAPNVAKPRRK